MVTLVGTETDFVEMLDHLLQLDLDAVEAYDLAPDRAIRHPRPVRRIQRGSRPTCGRYKELRPMLDKALQDEQRHRSWLEERLAAL